jgi:hypothetical protein
MSLSMHAASVPVFAKMSRNMLGWLDKAEAHAKARKFDPNNFVGMRLAPDMLPFARQIQIASDAAKGAVARLAGDEPPKWTDDEATLDQLRARIQKTIDYVESFQAHRLEGSEKRDIVMPIGPDRTLRMTGEAFLEGFSIPNFFFHVTMVYALLRHGGVEIGKGDFLGGL